MSRFDIGEAFQYHGTPYVIVQVPTRDSVVAKDQQHGTTVTFLLDDLLNAWVSRELRFPYKSGLGRRAQTTDLETLPVLPDLTQIAEECRQLARQRYSLVRELLMIPQVKRTRELIEQRIAALTKDWDHPPGVSSVYRWIQKFERAGYDVRALVPLYKERGGKGQTRLNPDHMEILWRAIKKCILVREPQPIQGAADYAEALLTDAGLPVPEPKTLYMQMKRLVDAIPPYEKATAQLGKKAADRLFKATGAGFPVKRVLQRVEIDHTPLDVLVMPEVPEKYRRAAVSELAEFAARPYITVCRDRLTRLILGWHVGFEVPSYRSVMECLRHAIRPKTRAFLKRECPDLEHDLPSYGKPETLVVDNGPEFQSRHLEDAGIQLNFEIEYNPPGSPWCKPIIERGFRSLNSVLHTLPGTTFSRLSDRGDYDSVKSARLPFSVLKQLLYIIFVDIENQRYNTDIGTSPYKAWCEAVEGPYPPDLPENDDELLVLLARVEYRQISAKGVQLEGLNYFNDTLADLRASLTKEECNVKVKSNPSDLGQIWVIDPRSDTFIEVPAEDQAYASGLTLWNHRVIKNLVRKTEGKVSHEKLVRGKAKIRAILERHLTNAKRVTSPQRVSRYMDGGRHPSHTGEETLRDQQDFQADEKPALPTVSTQPPQPASTQAPESRRTGRKRGASGEPAVGPGLHETGRPIPAAEPGVFADEFDSAFNHFGLERGLPESGESSPTKSKRRM